MSDSTFMGTMEPERYADGHSGICESCQKEYTEGYEIELPGIMYISICIKCGDAMLDNQSINVAKGFASPEKAQEYFQDVISKLDDNGIEVKTSDQ